MERIGKKLTMEYKRLGDYIAPAMEKNVGLKVHLSQGISNNKYFQDPRQVAQDSENDQIVRRGQFAFNKATTRNGEKISIAYRDGEDCTVSSAYQVFYIKDEEQLNPYYLMMWFKRPEFDRYARFKSHGSAHEFFTYEEMCNVLLPVPPIAEQRRIVSEYQTVERRIQNNEQLIKKLEETAQAIYHHTFVEGIDEESLPEGWRKGTLGEIANINPTRQLKLGNLAPNIDMAALSTISSYPLFIDYKIYNGGQKFQNGDTLMARITPCLENGKAGYVNFLKDGEVGFGSTEYIVLSPKDRIFPETLYFIVRNNRFIQYAVSNMNGTSGRQRVNGDAIEIYPILIPSQDVLDYFSKVARTIMTSITSASKENIHLRSLLSLLTSKLS